MTQTPTDALRLVRDLAAKGAANPGCDNWRAVSMCRQIVEVLDKAAPASPLPGGGWQDISTAPKDGRNILAWGYLHDDGGPYETDGRSFMGETPHEMVVYFSPEFGVWRDRSDGGSYAGLTHWMPLPAAPIGDA